MAKKNGYPPFLKHYDKILVVLTIVLLALSAFNFIFTNKAAETRRNRFQAKIESIKVAHPEVASIAGDVNATSNLFRRIANPDLIAWTATQGQPGFFIPEARVWCVKSDCHAPISPMDKVCPYCGTEQPGEPKPDVNADTDGDGIPDVWERKFGLNPLDPADASEDPDGDGFDNLAEFKAGTNPLDPKSHPDVLSLLRIDQIVATPLPIRFKSRGMLGPDKHYRSQFNYVDKKTTQDPPTVWIKEGERLVFSTGVGKIDTGYVFDKLEIKKEQRTIQGMLAPQNTEVAYAVIKRGKKSITLEEDKVASDSDYKVTLVQTLDNTVISIDGADAIFKLDDIQFHIKNIDMEKSMIDIVSTDGTVEVRISKDEANVNRERKNAVKDVPVSDKASNQTKAMDQGEQTKK